MSDNSSEIDNIFKKSSRELLRKAIKDFGYEKEISYDILTTNSFLTGGFTKGIFNDTLENENNINNSPKILRSFLIANLQSDGEDFSTSGDEDNDGLEVYDLNVYGHNVSFKIKKTLQCPSPSNITVMVDWGDGSTPTRYDSPAFPISTNKTLTPGEYKISVRIYCNNRLVATDSDVILI